MRPDVHTHDQARQEAGGSSALALRLRARRDALPTRQYEWLGLHLVLIQAGPMSPHEWESQSPTWHDIRQIRQMWAEPLVVRASYLDDARRAVDCGADAIVVSNHGGRQLENTPRHATFFPEIAAAIGDSAEILLDSGVHRGNDVLKALALGARAVLVGRSVVYGLAVAGADGVSWVLDLLRTDMVRSMRLMGLTSVDAVDASWVENICCRTSLSSLAK